MNLTSKVNIKVFPAKGGDAILISLNNYTILVDSGYPNTYKIIKKELEKSMYNKRLDMFIVTHIDNDHILGGIELLKDTGLNKQIKIDNILFNGYRQILGKKDLENSKDVDYKCKMMEISSIGEINLDEFEGESLDDIGYEEGKTFSELLKEKKCNINKGFPEGVFKKDSNSYNTINISNNSKIIIITPTKDKLINLIDKWRRYLRSEEIEEIPCRIIS
jgi:metal-dependent hydrolase (beta-lactamase superfamily II)